MHKREEMRGYKEIYAVNIRKHKCYSQWYDDRATTTDRPKFKH